MKIAIPVKPKNREKTEFSVSNSFGKARFFAIVNENDDIQIVETVETGGKNICNMLKNLGVDIILTSHLGRGAFNMAKSLNMRTLFIPDKIDIREAIDKYKTGDVEEITEKNLEKFAHHHHEHINIKNKRKI